MFVNVREKGKRAIVSLIMIVMLLVVSFPTPVFAASETEEMTFRYFAIGNSFTMHPVCDIWWGPYGMAASNQENDYVHRLESMVKPYYASVETNMIYYTKWERASGGLGRTAALSDLDGYLNENLDLVTIFLGENVVDYSYLDSDYQNLVNYVKAKAPNAKIVMVGMFWQDETQDAIKRSVSEASQIPYIDLHDVMNNEAFRAGMGTMVMGDDGTLHPISQEAVAAHPNDLAMNLFASRIFNQLGLSEMVRDGVDYSEIFDGTYYATKYPSVVSTYGNEPLKLLTYFLSIGVQSGQQASAHFSVMDYRNRYPDLQGAYGDNWLSYCKHYVLQGKKEGRTGIPMSVAEAVEEKCPANASCMYRMYNKNSGEHFYTESLEERQFLLVAGWYYEGIAWFAPKQSNEPVYRLYNTNSGEHHYTLSGGERDYLLSIGWNDEGIGWCSDENKTTPLYRVYNPNAIGDKEAGAHHYTTDVGERDTLVSIGWNDENVGWYGM